MTWTSLVARPTGCRCWAGSVSCGATSTQPTQTSGPSIALAERNPWLAFLPWPQAIRGEVELARGDAAGAARFLQQAFARACQLGDPCWEGMSAHGLALVAEAAGDSGRAFEILADARAGCNRLADPYVWLDCHVLDALSDIGSSARAPLDRSWVAEMSERASRAGMQELNVRALLHGARLGKPGDAEAAALLAGTVDNPRLAPLLVNVS